MHGTKASHEKVPDFCVSAICNQNYVLIRHDGKTDLGDTIASELSLNCNDSFTFNIDEYMGTVYITVTGVAEDVNGTLASPQG